jgi:hypothetical protein
MARRYGFRDSRAGSVLIAKFFAPLIFNVEYPRPNGVQISGIWSIPPTLPENAHKLNWLTGSFCWFLRDTCRENEWFAASDFRTHTVNRFRD